MSKYKITILITFLFFVSGCGVVKEGFKSPKQKTSDEFLVEKKSPLVMPPEFNELPVPNSSNKKTKKNEDTIESLISNSETKTDNNIKDSDQNLKKTILDKIKE
jgi:hypothetical protein|tara:strand:- start:1895 stop:2206 length:312 start_codon:yes stop_codon:yes gene_type:complete